jgi:hypothetical protein
MSERHGKESAREHYRRLAQACLEMAATIPEGEGREDLIEMARIWTHLAETYPDDNSKPTGASSETQPVMQQQQEVRPEKDDDKD